MAAAKTYEAWIGNIRIPCDSLDELEAVVRRLSGVTATPEKPAMPSGDTAKPKTPNGKSEAPAGATDNDMRLLRALSEAGDRGVPSGTAAALLGGARGRAVPPAMDAFCERVGLGQGACVPTPRINGKRSWKLTVGAQGAAKLKLSDGVAA